MIPSWILCPSRFHCTTSLWDTANYRCHFPWRIALLYVIIGGEFATCFADFDRKNNNLSFDPWPPGVCICIPIMDWTGKAVASIENYIQPKHLLSEPSDRNHCHHPSPVLKIIPIRCTCSLRMLFVSHLSNLFYPSRTVMTLVSWLWMQLSPRGPMLFCWL